MFLQYLEANNFFAMCKKLPLKSYKWADISMFDKEFIKNYHENGETG